MDKCIYSYNNVRNNNERERKISKRGNYFFVFNLYLIKNYEMSKHMFYVYKLSYMSHLL